MPTLDEIVSSAVSAAPALLEESGAIVPEGEESTSVETTPEKKVETKPETKKDETDDSLDEFGLNKQQQLEARQLLAGLRDPEKAPKILDFLATNAGYTKAEIKELETTKEIKEAKKGIVDSLKEALGPELSYLAEKMGPVIQSFLDEKVETSTKGIKESLASQQTEKYAQEADQAQVALGKKYFGENGTIPDSVASEMNAIIDEFPPTGKKTMAAYLEDVLILAAGRKQVPLGKSADDKLKKDVKVARLRNDASVRLASDGQTVSPKVGETAIHPKRQMTIDEAVKAANEAVKASLQ